MVLPLLLPAALAAEPPDLTGTWRLDLEVVTHAVVPVLGTTTVYTHQIMVATVVRDGARQVQTHDTCALQARSSRPLAEPTLPPAFVAAVPNKTYPLVLTPLPDGTWQVQADFQPLYIGYDPTVTGGALPQKAGDPGIVDWDGDGRPGATVLLDVPLFGRVEVYQAQRGRTILTGRVETPDRLAGGVRVDMFGQRTLSASNRLFAANPDLRMNPELSWFRQTRVPAGTTCATVGS